MRGRGQIHSKEASSSKHASKSCVDAKKEEQQKRCRVGGNLQKMVRVVFWQHSGDAEGSLLKGLQKVFLFNCRISSVPEVIKKKWPTKEKKIL